MFFIRLSRAFNLKYDDLLYISDPLSTAETVRIGVISVAVNHGGIRISHIREGFDEFCSAKMNSCYKPKKEISTPPDNSTENEISYNH